VDLGIDINSRFQLVDIFLTLFSHSVSCIKLNTQIDLEAVHVNLKSYLVLYYRLLPERARLNVIVFIHLTIIYTCTPHTLYLCFSFFRTPSYGVLNDWTGVASWLDRVLSWRPCFIFHWKFLDSSRQVEKIKKFYQEPNHIPAQESNWICSGCHLLFVLHLEGIERLTVREYIYDRDTRIGKKWGQGEGNSGSGGYIRREARWTSEWTGQKVNDMKTRRRRRQGRDCGKSWW